MTRTRFAPAPTGALHLGHVANALFVFGWGRLQGARVVLRIEDHDRQRSRVVFERALLDDLDWLGFEPDEYPTAAFRAGPCASRQSDRESLYRAHAARLREAGLVYGCTCSRTTVAAADPADAGDCPSRCRRRHVPADEGRTWRVHLGHQGPFAFDDALAGHVELDARPAVDPVIRDRLGNWTYAFAVVVDDFDQRIDGVIRGLDLLEATPGQIQLARAIGRPDNPRFAHHALIMKTPTAKLSKADGDAGIGALRANGWTPADVVGRAAHLVGLTQAAGPIAPAAVPDLFARLTAGS